MKFNMAEAAKAPKANKVTKPKAPTAHPKYSVMIAAAITALKDRTGSSRGAILKHIVANNKVDAAKAATQVRLALKRGVAKGALKMARASGKGAGSFKLVEVAKVNVVKKAKKSAVKNIKKTKAVKKPTVKKSAAKKAKKSAAKKPAARKVAKKLAARMTSPKKPAARMTPLKKK